MTSFHTTNYPLQNSLVSYLCLTTHVTRLYFPSPKFTRILTQCVHMQSNNSTYQLRLAYNVIVFHSPHDGRHVTYQCIYDWIRNWISCFQGEAGVGHHYASSARETFYSGICGHGLRYVNTMTSNILLTALTWGFIVPQSTAALYNTQ